MVVVAVMTVVALGVTSILQNITVATTTQKYTSETSNFNEEVRALLADPEACRRTFTSAPIVLASPINAVINQLRDGLNNVVVDTNVPATGDYGDNSGRLTKMVIDTYQDTTPGYGVAEFRLFYTPRGAVQGTRPLARLIMLQTHKNAGNALDRCVQLAKMSDGIWQIVPANMPFDSFFSGGALGIGTTAPVADLDVRGQVAWGDSLGSLSVLNSDQGGSIELGAPDLVTNPVAVALNEQPAINFHYGYNVMPGPDVQIVNQTAVDLAVYTTNAGRVQVAKFNAQNGFNPYYMSVNSPAGAGAHKRLDVNGPVNLLGGARFFADYIPICSAAGCVRISDMRLKENIKPLKNSLAAIDKLQGVTFDWIDPVKYTPRTQVGMIAQEVEKVYPEVVQTDGLVGYKSMTYDNLVAPAIEAIKTLYENATGLKARVDALKIKNKKLAQENAEIQRRLEALEKKVGR